MQLTLSLFCILICFNLQSQPCPKYDKALNLGKDALKKENYQEALNQFQDAQLAARECPKIANEPAAAQIQEVF